MTAPFPALAYKVLTADQWETLAAEGCFKGAPIDLDDGYVHLSAAEQVTQTVDRHFAGQQDLWIAAVDLAALGDGVRWETSRGDALFPHYYGVLPLSAVVAHGPLEREADGSVRLPVA